MAGDPPDFEPIRVCQGGIVVVPASIARHRRIEVIQGGAVIIYPDHLGPASVGRQVEAALAAQLEEERMPPRIVAADRQHPGALDAVAEEVRPSLTNRPRGSWAR